jgi:hypothetical protein
MKLYSIKFTKSVAPYNSGESAGFVYHIAKRYVDAGRAEWNNPADADVGGSEVVVEQPQFTGSLPGQPTTELPAKPTVEQPVVPPASTLVTDAPKPGVVANLRATAAKVAAKKRAKKVDASNEEEDGEDDPKPRKTTRTKKKQKR